MSNTKQYKSKAFIKLQRAWYDKLKESGFIDVELSTNHKLRQDPFYIGLQYNYFTAKYYEIARYLGNNAIFLSNIDSKLLKLHGNGYTIEKISNYLRNNVKFPLNWEGRKRKPYSTFWVYHRIKALKVLVFIYADTSDLESVKKAWQLL